MTYYTTKIFFHSYKFPILLTYVFLLHIQYISFCIDLTVKVKLKKYKIIYLLPEEERRVREQATKLNIAHTHILFVVA